MDLEQLKKEAREVNLALLRKEINSEWVLLKIEKYLEKNPFLNYTIEDVKQEILNNDLIASFFIKEPGRQNITEKAVANKIKKFKKVKDFINLPPTANLFVEDGEITNKRKLNKSIDYTWKTGDKKVYASQKYTKDSGGSQDNQYKDIVSFLSSAIKSQNKEIVFFAIVDGNYFDNQLKTKLRTKYETSHVKICSLEELENYLEQI